MSRPNAQSMKPATAAKKLDVTYRHARGLPGEPDHPAANSPRCKQSTTVAPRPPEVRAAPEEPGGSQTGCPSPVSRGRHRGSVTTDQINQLIEENPPWLAAERESYQRVLTEQRRLKAPTRGTFPRRRFRARR